MADRVWIGRGEQLMLFLAYVLTFLVVLVAVIVGKSTTMFMISQVRTGKRGVVAPKAAYEQVNDAFSLLKVCKSL